MRDSIRAHFDQAFHYADAAFAEADKAFAEADKLFAEADRLVKPEMNRPHAHRVRFAASSLANRLHLTKRFLKLALQALFTGKAELQFRYHDKNQPENH